MTSFNQNLADSFVRFIFTLLLNNIQNNLIMRNQKCPLSDNQAALQCQSETLIDDHGVSRADWGNVQMRGKVAKCFLRKRKL